VVCAIAAGALNITAAEIAQKNACSGLGSDYGPNPWFIPRKIA
jgi:hypothetical protein